MITQQFTSSKIYTSLNIHLKMPGVVEQLTYRKVSNRLAKFNGSILKEYLGCTESQ